MLKLWLWLTFCVMNIFSLPVRPPFKWRLFIYPTGGNLCGSSHSHTCAPLLWLLCQFWHHSEIPSVELLCVLCQVTVKYSQFKFQIFFYKCFWDLGLRRCSWNEPGFMRCLLSGMALRGWYCLSMGWTVQSWSVQAMCVNSKSQRKFCSCWTWKMQSSMWTSWCWGFSSWSSDWPLTWFCATKLNQSVRTSRSIQWCRQVWMLTRIPGVSDSKQTFNLSPLCLYLTPMYKD